jgi:uncharacterized membrane protein YeaQ/YmgE (transglycosylase-associated protein family)
MTPGMLVMCVIVGLIAGYLAGYGMKEGGYGPIGDLSLGVIGSLVGSGLFLFLGVSPDAGVVALVLVAFIGATALIFAQHRLWPTHA